MPTWHLEKGKSAMGSGTSNSKQILTRLFKLSSGAAAFALSVWFVQRIDHSISNFTVQDLMNAVAMILAINVGVMQTKAAFAPTTRPAR